MIGKAVGMTRLQVFTWFHFFYFTFFFLSNAHQRWQESLRHDTSSGVNQFCFLNLSYYILLNCISCLFLIFLPLFSSLRTEDDREAVGMYVYICVYMCIHAYVIIYVYMFFFFHCAPKMIGKPSARHVFIASMSSGIWYIYTFAHAYV